MATCSGPGTISKTTVSSRLDSSAMPGATSITHVLAKSPTRRKNICTLRTKMVINPKEAPSELWQYHMIGKKMTAAGYARRQILRQSASGMARCITGKMKIVIKMDKTAATARTSPIVCVWASVSAMS